MAQPQEYNRTKDFTVDFQNETDHVALNAEFDGAANSINQIRANLALIQADDGGLRPGIVDKENLAAGLINELIADVDRSAIIEQLQYIPASKDELDGKQDLLIFDNEPKQGSLNPVYSGGIYNALQQISISSGDNITVKASNSTVNRTLAERFADVVNVSDYGAKGDGTTNDTNAINSAISVANTKKKALFFPNGKYKVSALVFPDDTRILGNVYFLDNGNGAVNSYVLKFGKNSRLNDIHLTMTENSRYRYGIRLAEGCTVGNVLVDAATRFNGEALHCSGDNISVGFLETHKVNRGGNIGAYVDVEVAGSGSLSGGVTHYKNISLGGYLLDGMVQGLRIGRASYCKIGNGRVSGLPDTETRVPSNGHNGLLIGGSDNISIGDIVLDRTLEHGIRIGGDDVVGTGSPQISHDISFGKITSSRHGGSALKINSGSEQRTYNISVDQLVSIDSGLRPRSVNRREGALRISHCTGFTCGEVFSVITNPESIGSTIHDVDTNTDRTYSPDVDVIEINNCEKVDIGFVATDFFERSVISFNEENDITVANAQFSTSNISIRGVSAVDNQKASGTFCLCFFRNTAMPVSKVFLSNVDIQGTGFSGYFASYTEANLSNFEMSCYAKQPLPLRRFSWLKQSVIGFGTGYSTIGNSRIPDLASGYDSAAAVIESPASESTGCGATLVFARRTTSRPSGAVSAYQYDTEHDGNAGLAFLTSDSISASDVIEAQWGIRPSPGDLHPFNDNTSSIGKASQRVKEIFCATSTINTSDERLKDDVADVSDAVLDAWGDVNIKVFRFKDAIALKGESARIHMGVIAQQVKQAFESHGLDAFRYGLLCYDEWEERQQVRVVVDSPEVLDQNGNVIEEQVAHEETETIPAGNRYSIRYEEALVLEAAYQRRRADRMEERILALEQQNQGEQ